MPSSKIHRGLQSETYFLTFTIKHWYYIFDRYDRWTILANSLKHCQQNKGLKLHAFVFMLNHLHLIASAPDMIEFVKAFKTHTSKEIKRNIATTEPRILSLFQNKKDEWSFWQNTNMPIQLVTQKFYNQKLNYIINNPIKKAYVMRAEDWYWSSANGLCELKCNIE